MPEGPKDEGIAGSDHHDLPLVSRAALDGLWDDLRNPTAHAAYLRRNQELWPERYEQLSGAIRRADPTAAMDAVLRLRSASQMIGALKLAAVALEMERALGDGRLGSAEALLEELQVCGRTTMARLSEEFPSNDTGWRLLEGGRVEIQFPGGATEIGVVDAVTDDGLILWLRQDGVSPRHLVENLPGVWIRLASDRQ